MKVAISPCPNDTFLFHAWIAGHVGKEIPPQVVFADIQHLNEWALKEAYPLIKLSFPCFAKVAHAYQLLPIGSALGYNCGPKLISKTFFPLSQLPQKRVAIPGKNTTAHLLLSNLLPNPKEKIFCLYNDITDLIEKQIADCGVIIHESRFTFQQVGFHEIVDLGEMWHQQKKIPLPLGGIAIARTTPKPVKERIITILRASLKHAQTAPDDLLPFILHHSQEKDSVTVHKHIQTYVNRETEQLSTNGKRAIEMLVDCDLPNDWLYPYHE